MICEVIGSNNVDTCGPFKVVCVLNDFSSLTLWSSMTGSYVKITMHEVFERFIFSYKFSPAGEPISQRTNIHHAYQAWGKVN